MKKLINGLAIVFFLAPVFASAASCASFSGSYIDQNNFGGVTNRQARSVTFTVASQCDIGNITADLAQDVGTSDNATVTIYDSSGGLPTTPLSSTASFPTPPNVPLHALETTSLSYCLPAGTYSAVFSRTGSLSDTFGYYWGVTSFSGGTNSVKNSGTWASDSAQYILEIDDGGNACGGGGGGGNSLASIIDNSTSSLERVTGIGFNSMALWGWVNIGKPALGTGLGTLYVLRWYILSIIALSIIIYFAFRYYGFFKH